MGRGGREKRTGPHLSSTRRPLRSSDSFLLASSTLAFSRSALERAEATDGGPRTGPSRSRSSRLGLASGSRPREEGPWAPGVRAWVSSSEGTRSSFFADEGVRAACVNEFFVYLFTVHHLFINPHSLIHLLIYSPTEYLADSSMKIFPSLPCCFSRAILSQSALGLSLQSYTYNQTFQVLDVTK